MAFISLRWWYGMAYYNFIASEKSFLRFILLRYLFYKTDWGWRQQYIYRFLLESHGKCCANMEFGIHWQSEHERRLKKKLGESCIKRAKLPKGTQQTRILSLLYRHFTYDMCSLEHTCNQLRAEQNIVTLNAHCQVSEMTIHTHKKHLSECWNFACFCLYTNWPHTMRMREAKMSSVAGGTYR